MNENLGRKAYYSIYQAAEICEIPKSNVGYLATKKQWIKQPISFKDLIFIRVYKILYENRFSKTQFKKEIIDKYDIISRGFKNSDLLFLSEKMKLVEIPDNFNPDIFSVNYPGCTVNLDFSNSTQETLTLENTIIPFSDMVSIKITLINRVSENLINRIESLEIDNQERNYKIEQAEKYLQCA